MSSYETMRFSTGESLTVPYETVAERLKKLEALKSAAGHAALGPLVENFHTERIPLDDGCEPQMYSHGRLNVVVADLADGTKLVVPTRSIGDAEGWPVIVHHGTAFNAWGPHPPLGKLKKGVRWVTLSRAGYDRPPCEGRIVADSATDTDAVAKAYGFDRYSVMGRSTGGLHALACLALLPEAVNGALVSSIAPPDWVSDWTRHMSEDNKRKYRQAQDDPIELLRELDAIARRSGDDPEALLKHLQPQMSPSDQKYLDPFTSDMKRAVIARAHAAALRREGALGWLDDIIAARVLPLGFEPAAITKPVYLIQGDDDPFTSIEHYVALMQNIPGVIPRLIPEIGHMGTLDEVLMTVAKMVREARRLTLPESFAHPQ